MNVLQTDVLVVGSEGAGGRAAIEAASSGLQVTIATKGQMGRCGATITGGGGMVVDSRSARELFGLAGDPADSERLFFEDTVVEGRYVNNQRIVEVHVSEAPQCMKELNDWGVEYTGVQKTSGHRYPRNLRFNPQQLMRVMRRRARDAGVRIQEHFMLTDFLVSDGRVAGAVGIDLTTGDFIAISARAVILATGGGQALFPVTTAPEELTGDGHAAAWRAGAELVDMEMIQFLPCVLIDPPAMRGLQIPYTLGPIGGLDLWLLNKRGDRFMLQWDPVNKEKTGRDVLANAMMTEIKAGRGSPKGGLWLSFAHLPGQLIDLAPTWLGKPILKDDWSYYGFNFKEFMEEVKTGRAMDVGVASHFYMGGVKIDETTRTSLEGLFAAGETTGGTHGGNRMSGNAYTQVIVQGKVAGREAAAYAASCDRPKLDLGEVERLRERAFAPLNRNGGSSAFQVKKKIQNLAWEKVGVLRDRPGLEEALAGAAGLREEVSQVSCACKDLAYNREWMEAIQSENMLTLMESIARSALTRTESRGSHYRTDHPKGDLRRCFYNIHQRREGSEARVWTEPLVITGFEPPAGEEV